MFEGSGGCERGNEDSVHGGEDTELQGRDGHEVFYQKNFYFDSALEIFCEKIYKFESARKFLADSSTHTVSRITILRLLTETVSPSRLIKKN
jgi:hypothetical protein